MLEGLGFRFLWVVEGLEQILYGVGRLTVLTLIAFIKLVVSHGALHTHTYMHTYIYIYAYIHTYIHTYVHTYIHTYIHTYMYVGFRAVLKR